MVDPKAHQLYKQLDSCLLNVTNASAGTGTVTNQWDLLDLSVVQAVITNRTYIDLQGWSAQDLTTFTQGVDIQKQQIPLKNTPGPTSQTIWEFDFITTRRLSDTELLNLANLPGFAESTVDLMEVIYGERMLYGENGTIPGSYVQISGDTFGSGNPTAMSRMHWTRLIVIHIPGDLDQVGIFPTNLVVQAMTVEEKDLVWMERLRRSYVHQDRADI
ncbi:MAG TPA: hypothetical protein EYM97_03100 [Gemmatimonadetes bacterium]|nr:hypothetical protein [Gemmatimonadota bacterium]